MTARNVKSMNFSALKRAHKARVVPDLREADIEESFVRGTYYPVCGSMSLPLLLHMLCHSAPLLSFTAFGCI